MMMVSVLMMTTEVKAQAAVATVNQEAITASDVQERTALLKVFSRGKAPARTVVINELIDEKLKLAEAARLGISVDDAETKSAFAELAKANKLTSAKLGETLSKMGTSEAAFRKRLKAEISWARVVRSRMATEDKGVSANLPTTSGQKAIEYIVRPVVLAVPRGSEGNVRSRMAEANALRAKFNGCEEGAAYLRTLKDVAVREPVGRSSLHMSEEVAELLEKTAVGRLSPPFRGELGVEMLAVCHREEVVDDGLFGRPQRQARSTKAPSPKEYEAKSKTLLKTLRDQAQITRG